MPTPNTPDESTPRMSSPKTIPEGDLSQGTGDLGRLQQPSGLPASASADPIPPSVAARMAAELGINQTVFWNYERGRTVPLDIVVRLWRQYGISPKWLLTGAGNMRLDSFPPGNTAAEVICNIVDQVEGNTTPCSFKCAEIVSDLNSLRDLVAHIATEINKKRGIHKPISSDWTPAQLAQSERIKSRFLPEWIRDLADQIWREISRGRSTSSQPGTEGGR